MIIEYNCKFCHRHGEVEVDNGIEMFTIRSWQHFLCCNRCADFMVSKRKLVERINKIADALSVARSGFSSQSKISAVESTVRSKFEFYTRQFAKLVYDYFNKATVWDEEFVNLLMEKPGDSHIICARYIRGIRTV